MSIQQLLESIAALSDADFEKAMAAYTRGAKKFRNAMRELA